MRTATEQEYREAYGNGFQNLDNSDDWRHHNPESEWTEEDTERDRVEKAMAKAAYEAEQQAQAFWWDLEGVRCATFGDPGVNPYEAK